MIVTFQLLGEVFEEWKSTGIPVIVWPLGTHAEHEGIETVAPATQTSRRKIVTAWPPLTIQNRVKQTVISDLWRTLVESLLACAGVKQMPVSSSQPAKFALKKGVRKVVHNTTNRML